MFALIDELADAFEADAFHVGMDEVFRVASDQCPRCRGKSPAAVFTTAVNDLHRHLVQDKKMTMLMWGDRLLEDRTMGYGKWESSDNGTVPAIDQVPTDIILCDWHYELRDHYPSVSYFQQKGFRVWPASWNNPKAALALLEEGRRVNQGLVIGHLGTTWGSAPAFCKALLEPGGELPKDRRGSVQGAVQRVSGLHERHEEFATAFGPTIPFRVRVRVRDTRLGGLFAGQSGLLSGRGNTSRAASRSQRARRWSTVKFRSGGRTGPQSTPSIAMTFLDATRKPNSPRVLMRSIDFPCSARAMSRSRSEGLHQPLIDGNRKVIGVADGAADAQTEACQETLIQAEEDVKGSVVQPHALLKLEEVVVGVLEAAKSGNLGPCLVEELGHLEPDARHSRDVIKVERKRLDSAAIGRIR